MLPSNSTNENPGSLPLASFGRPTSLSLELDRLVDGSLGEEVRHRLLLTLDQEPDGWKHCALAFLEAQTFRDAMGPLLDLPDQVNQAVPVSHHSLSAVPFPTLAPKPASTFKMPSNLLGMAASAALAFGAGWWANSTPVNTTEPSIAQLKNSVQEPGPTETPQPAISITETQKESPAPNNPSVESTIAIAQKTEAESNKQDKQIQALRQLGDTLRRLEKQGYSADMQKELVAFKTPDGRKVEVPVQQLVLKYRGKQTY